MLPSRRLRNDENTFIIHHKVKILYLWRVCVLLSWSPLKIHKVTTSGSILLSPYMDFLEVLNLWPQEPHGHRTLDPIYFASVWSGGIILKCSPITTCVFHDGELFISPLNWSGCGPPPRPHMNNFPPLGVNGAWLSCSDVMTWPRVCCSGGSKHLRLDGKKKYE